jgi:5-methylcytosine-specific restriction endonuclease McrA
MKWDWETLNLVYDKTRGRCRYCKKQLSWSNYGMPRERGAWEVEHSVPLFLGGTDYLSNLWPACIDCNRNKGTMTGPQYMRLFERPRRSSSSGGILPALAGVTLLYLLYRALTQSRQDSWQH